MLRIAGRRISPIFAVFVFFALAAASLWAMKLYVEKRANGKLRALTNRAAQKADISWGRVEARLLSPDLVVHDIAVRFKGGFNARIGKIVLTDYNTESSRPLFAVFKVKQLRIPVNRNNFGEAVDGLHHLGYRIIEADADMDIAFDPTHHLLRIDAFHLDIENFFELRLNMLFKNFYPERIRKMAVAAITIDTAEAVYKDSSLLKRLALAMRHDHTDFYNFFLLTLQWDIERAQKEQNADAMASISALKNFLERPSDLNIGMNLKRTVSLGQILASRRVSDLMALIQFRVSRT